MGEAILALPSSSHQEISCCHCSHVPSICSVICCVIQEYAFTLSVTHISITHSDALNWRAYYSKAQPRSLTGASPAIFISESNFVWDHENLVFLLCLCLWCEVWEGTSEGLFLPVVVIFIESLKVQSLRCCFYTCSRLSSIVPFLPKCSRSHPHFPTCLSSGECIAWAHHSLVDANRQDILETLLIAVSSGGYKCCKPQDFTKHFWQLQIKEKSTLVTVTGFHGLYLIVGCAFIIILYLYQLRCHCIFFNHHCIFDVF